MESLIAQVTNYFLDIVGRLGHFGVFLTLFLEGTWFPISSDSVLLLAGFLASAGRLNPFLVALSAALGFTLGSCIPYAVVTVRGRSFIERYGKWGGVTPERLARSEAWFTRYGLVVLVVARFLPVFRALMAVPAGLARVRPSTYLLTTFFGYLPWGLAITFLGAKVGQRWGWIKATIERLDAVLLVAIGSLAAVLYLVLRARTPRRGPEPE